MSAPRISILLPVHDPGAMLAPLAKRILDEQTYPHELIQLVVVDDASSDGAPAAVGAERAGDDRLVLRRAEFRQLDASRNFARANATGELLAMTDHDCMPAQDWLERAVAHSRPGGIVAGKINFAASRKPTVWELLDMTHHLDQERYVRDGAAVTANLFISAATFDELGGLDEGARNAGDFEFTRRASGQGIALEYVDDVVVVHPTRSTRLEYLKKVRRIASAQGQLAAQDWQAKYWIYALPGSSTILRMIKQRRLTALDSTRLAESGVTVSLLQHIRATLTELFIVGPVEAYCRLRALREERRGG